MSESLEEHNRGWSCRRHHGGDITKEASGRRYGGGDIIQERNITADASQRRHHRGRIMEEASWRRCRGSGKNCDYLRSSRNHLKPSRDHLEPCGDRRNSKRSRVHLGTNRRASGIIESHLGHLGICESCRVHLSHLRNRRKTSERAGLPGNI